MAKRKTETGKGKSRRNGKRAPSKAAKRKAVAGRKKADPAKAALPGNPAAGGPANERPSPGQAEHDDYDGDDEVDPSRPAPTDDGPAVIFHDMPDDDPDHGVGHLSGGD